MVGGMCGRRAAIATYKHPSKPNVVTILGHPGDELPKGTLKAILKAANLEAKE